MKTRIVHVIVAGAALLAAAGCGSPEEGLARQTEQYQVIDEGAVTGVTSTIHAPGDMATVAPPTPDVTGTNLDTTTAFTILDPRISTAPPSPLDTQTLPPAVSAPPPGGSPAPGMRQPVTPTPVRRAPEREETPSPPTPAPDPAPTATPVTPKPLPTPSATLPPQPDPEPEPEPETEPEEPEPTPPPATDTNGDPDGPGL